MTSRRDVLKALALVGGTACRRRSGGRTIEGSIVGADAARGHRLLREASGTPVRREHVGVVIAGGGIAGLSAAWGLERAGAGDFLVLELEDVSGGTSRSGRNAVSAYPWAAHYVPAPADRNPALELLLDEVGAMAGRDEDGRPVWREEVLCRDPQERLFFHGEWYEGLYPRVGASPEDLRQLAAFDAEMLRWARWRDEGGRRAFDLPRAGGSRADVVRALDDDDMASWMAARGFTSERLRYVVDYGCRDDFGSTPEQTSAWAGVHYYASRLREDGTSVPDLTWPEGNGRLVAHLAGVCGPRLRTGALVTSIDPGPDRVLVRYLDTARAETVEVVAEHGVFAGPRFVAARVVAPWRERTPPFLAAVRYVPWVVANLTLRGRPRERGFPPAWDNVIHDSPALGYVSATHQSGRDHGPTVLTWYEAIAEADVDAARRRLLGIPWDEWVGRVVADLRPAHPDLSDLLDRVDVFVWGHAMVRPAPGLLWSDALARCGVPLGRLRFAHTDLSGMALVEEAQDHGLRAARSILEERGAAPPAWFPLTPNHLSSTLET